MRKPLSASRGEIGDGTTDYKPLRKRFIDPGVQASGYPAEGITWRNFAGQIKWFNATISLIVPALGLIAAQWVPLTAATALFSLFYYFSCGLGITAGYHRLWAHRSYKSSLPLRVYLAAAGAGTVQGSARWWCREHRIHHRYTDTDKDPYSIRKGLLYSHIGWILLKTDPAKRGRTDITDLDADPVVVWQHKHYIKCALFMGFICPTLICGLGWRDWAGGLVYAGILRTFLFQQATFCVNSLAHWLGEQPFQSEHSPRDHFFTALVTLGEGYHNFHHEFPSDYRNAVKWFQYDPTKWAIATWAAIGLASRLQKFPQNEIEKGRVQQLQKEIDEKSLRLDWGKPLHQLPTCTWQDYVLGVAQGSRHIVVSGVIYDVAGFETRHPGGAALLLRHIGRDATAVFNGGVHEHSAVAHNLLATMRVAALRGGQTMEHCSLDRALLDSTINLGKHASEGV